MGQPMTAEEWRKRAAALELVGGAFVDGRYTDARSGEVFDSVSPIDGAVLARVAACDAPDVGLAVSSARKAFEDGRWRNRSPAQRKRVLLRLAELVRAHREDLALVETLDMGKPIRDSLAIDARATANCFAWYGEAVDKLYDEVAPTGPDALALITREPMGVIGAIVPWNFPLVMAAWKLAPALASGNSVVLKPSEKSPLSALILARLAVEAGLPEGVLNVVPGFGHTAGKALALHPDVDCLAFTGSTAVGKQILQYSGQSNMKRVWLECGGKAPNVVMGDCPDLAAAAQAAAWGIFFNQGEMCSAASRLLVAEEVREEILDGVLAIGRELQPGDPLDPATRLGAIVDETQLARVLGYIEKGREEGATLRIGGEQARADSGGFFVAPTVFDDVRNDMTIAQEEIFGPVLVTIPFRDEEEALRLANDVSYGLTAAVWTRDVSRAHRVARAMRAGTVYVNCYDADDITVPFGGYKQSGIGRDKSLHAFDKYTELKTTWVNLK